MVNYETEVEGTTKRGPVMGFAGQAANVAGDALELAELQAKLAQADAAAALKSSIKPVVVIVLGGCGVIACLPVVVLGLAYWLDAVTLLNAWQSMLLVAGVGLLIASIATYVATRALAACVKHFNRTTREFANNVAWAKSVLRSGRL